MMKTIKVSDKGQISIPNSMRQRLGIDRGDKECDLDFMVKKCSGIRIFNDDFGKLNYSVLDKSFEILVISQFTLLSDIRKGFRPSFHNAAPPEKAEMMYNDFINRIKAMGIKTESGVFGAMMDIRVNNDGPVTIIINSKKELMNS